LATATTPARIEYGGDCNGAAGSDNEVADIALMNDKLPYPFLIRLKRY
jgi:hypothetical protein